MLLHRLPIALLFLTLTGACSSGSAPQGGAESGTASAGGGQAGGAAKNTGGQGGEGATDPSAEGGDSALSTDEGAGGGSGTTDGGVAEPTVACTAEQRACVCEEWQQSDCCDVEWTTFCALTAQQKCGAASACTAEVTPPETEPQNACCEQAATPGCSDAAVEQCVCELLPDCCTNAWDSLCVQLVREQHCEPSVRSCLCEDWEQASCCDTEWTTFCTITAEEKCAAQATCGP